MHPEIPTLGFGVWQAFVPVTASSGPPPPARRRPAQPREIRGQGLVHVPTDVGKAHETPPALTW
jgi:hypothetical protein